MKKNLFVSFVLFCVLIFSCRKPNCPGTKCYNGGLKEGGGSDCTCICPYGYVGANCDTEARQLYLGNYSAQCYDNNGFSCGKFTMQVIANADSMTGINLILITDTLSGALNLTNLNIAVPNQTVNGVTYVGSGLFQSGTIVLTLNSSAAGVASTYYYQGPKQ